MEMAVGNGQDRPALLSSTSSRVCAPGDAVGVHEQIHFNTHKRAKLKHRKAGEFREGPLPRSVREAIERYEECSSMAGQGPSPAVIGSILVSLQKSSHSPASRDRIASERAKCRQSSTCLMRRQVSQHPLSITSVRFLARVPGRWPRGSLAGAENAQAGSLVTAMQDFPEGLRVEGMPMYSMGRP
jgi:hypothetical protein